MESQLIEVMNLKMHSIQFVNGAAPVSRPHICPSVFHARHGIHAIPQLSLK
jgi:hypothetical protein